MFWAFMLILLGLIFLVAEVFIPSGGILSILTIICMVCGVTLIFFTDPSEGGGPVPGLVTLAVLFVLIPILVMILLNYWDRTPFGKKFILHEGDEASTMADSPDYLELEHLKGQIGKSVTPLRPAGTILIEGHRIDSKTEGMYVEADQWVKVISVRPGQVIVRPLSQDELDRLPEELT